MSVQTPGQKSCVCLIGNLLGASGTLKCLSRSVQTLPGLLMHNAISNHGALTLDTVFLYAITSMPKFFLEYDTNAKLKEGM